MLHPSRVTPDGLRPERMPPRSGVSRGHPVPSDVERSTASPVRRGRSCSRWGALRHVRAGAPLRGGAHVRLGLLRYAVHGRRQPAGMPYGNALRGGRVRPCMRAERLPQSRLPGRGALRRGFENGAPVRACRARPELLRAAVRARAEVRDAHLPRRGRLPVQQAVQPHDTGELSEGVRLRRGGRRRERVLPDVRPPPRTTTARTTSVARP